MVDSDGTDKQSGLLKRRITRREALSTAAAAGAIVGVAVVAGAGGYFAAPRGGGAATTMTETATATQTQTVTAAGGGAATVTQTMTETMTASAVSAGVAGATPAERAVNGIKALRAAGKIPAGAKIRYLDAAFRGGNMTPKEGEVRKDPFTGAVVQEAINMLKKWESLTGVPVELDLLNDLELYD